MTVIAPNVEFVVMDPKGDPALLLEDPVTKLWFEEQELPVDDDFLALEYSGV